MLGLPFPEGDVEWIVARHMLYYVDDLTAALSEIRRVLGPDGAFLATTNAAATTPRIGQLYLDLLDTFGLPPVRHATGTFHTESAMVALPSVWPDVTEMLLDNAFVFTAPEPIANYLATMLPSVEGITGPHVSDEMLAWLHREAANRLAASGGTWRDPKAVGLCTCR